MTKKFLIIGLCIVMVLTMITGCSKKTDAPSLGENFEESNDMKSKKPTKFIYRISSDPPTLDPQVNNKSVGNTINSVLFEGLIGEDENLDIEAGVAEKWDISDDGIFYTFYLRKDAKWSDGQSIITKDFLYSWKRALNPEYAVKLSNEFFYIKNAEEYYKGEKEFSDVGIQMVDDYTIKIELSNPVPEDEMLSRFTSKVFYPLREDIIEANPDDWTLHPETCISNGPFKMKSYKMNEEIVMVKDENYWNRENKGKVDELCFVFISDGTTTLRAFESGDIDGFSGVPSEEVPRLKMESDEFHIIPALSFSYFALNVTKPPIDNPKVREALVLAIDKQKVVEASVSGLSKPATGIVPYGLVVNGVDFREEGDRNGDILPVNGDIERAKAALAEAGYPDGQGFPKIEYLYNASPGNKQTAEILQEMWKKNLNIDVELVNVEYKVESERRHSGDFQLARSAWNGDRFPISFLQIFATGNANNNPQYSNPKYDELIKEIRAESDIFKRNVLLHKAEEMALADYIVCPISYGSSTLLIKNKVKDLKITPTGGVIFDYVYIDE
ncbi:peptide ABC transporter substrate-binding protein [Tissierella sp. MSJ-40]|uniref:Peptide ABC transporter substrate-binding protein n=1 Tax=Tissierella simiarum TaxID=2841534 RepID=A0ABS6E2D7_9FIRM|nr:peptide ABC transporter substrate-binding protein [Tissierella simiarum]MBU5437075.1 peptide ABC transporter substrate-binding protein [Tissierella simiarum]